MPSVGSAPSSPDFGPLARAAEGYATQFGQAYQDQLAWAKQQYGNNAAFISNMQNLAGSTAQDLSAAQQQDRARYQSVYQPLEDQQAQQALNYDTPERRELMRGRAEASVASQFDTAGQAAQRQLESYGIDPSATRYGALDIGVRTSKAAAQAAAANQSDLAVEQQGAGLVNQALQTGENVAGRANTEAGGAIGGATSATAIPNSTYSTYSGALGNPLGFGGLTNTGVGTWNQALSTGYNAALGGYNAQQGASLGAYNAYTGASNSAAGINGQQSSGIGSLIGTGAGLAALAFLKDGGTVPGPKGTPPGVGGALPVGGHQAINTGMKVTPGMSPSHGRVTDDVRAQVRGGGPILVDEGEFIMPKFATDFFGTKYLHNMIEKAKLGHQPKQPKKQALPVGG